jgi:hypothetical protein
VAREEDVAMPDTLMVPTILLTTRAALLAAGALSRWGERKGSRR